MKRISVSVLVALGVLGAIGAPAKKMKDSSENFGVPYVHAMVQEPTAADIPMFTEEQFNEEIKQAKKRGQRSIAAVSESSLESDFVGYRDRVLKIKDTPQSSKAADELDAILYELEQDSAKSPALQFFAAQMTPLRSFRGFFHKIRPLARKYPVVQSYLVTMAKQMASNVSIFLTDSNSEHMKVMFRYISEPYTYNTKRKEKVEIKYSTPGALESYGISAFYTEKDIQNWLLADVAPRLKNAVADLNKISLKDKVIVWDNKLIAGTDAYPDKNDRFRSLSEGERNSVLSNYYGNLSNIYVFCSYSATGLLSLVRELGFLYGVEEMDVFNPAEMMKPRDQRDVVLKGASAAERTDKIRKFLSRQKLQKNEQRLFTLLPEGKTYMRMAYANSLASNSVANIAWTEIQQRPDDDSMVLDGGIFRPFIKVTNKSLSTMTRILNGNLEKQLNADQVKKVRKGELAVTGKQMEDNFMPIRSAISGDEIQANVVKFFFSPPEDLSVFLPSDFNKEPVEYTSDVTNPKGEKVKYRNYFHGTATSWTTDKFKPYFKMANGKEVNNNEDIKTILRVTTQSWGGLMIGMTLTGVML